MATKEAVFGAASQQLGPALIHAPQLVVGCALQKIILLTELCTPTGLKVGIDGIICSAAYQPVCRDVLVVVKVVDDGLVELLEKSAYV